MVAPMPELLSLCAVAISTHTCGNFSGVGIASSTSGSFPGLRARSSSSRILHMCSKAVSNFACACSKVAKPWVVMSPALGAVVKLSPLGAVLKASPHLALEAAAQGGEADRRSMYT